MIDDCLFCGGTGAVVSDGRERTCPGCLGLGISMVDDGQGHPPMPEECPCCEGRGWLHCHMARPTCVMCRGTGGVLSISDL